jgi:ferric-dicitrate binding protein FerR (iron transport regulator)
MKKFYSEFEKEHEIAFSRTKEEIWELLAEKADIPVSKKNISYKKYFYAVAAMICLMLMLATFARFHKKEIVCPAGEHLKIVLACGSEITLNAGSKYCYYPYWWNISRISTLQGEAFFDVKPGKSFIVKSKNNTSRVLGTSFNIFSRNKDYRIFCISGTVGVSSHSGENLIVQAGIGVQQEYGEKLKYEDISVEQALGWKNKLLIYTSKPLKDVFREIERQYNISFEYPNQLDTTITGAYPIDIEIEELLTIICKPFNISSVKISKNKFKLILN